MRPIVLLLLLASMTLAGIHIIALELYLYWYFLWLDIPVHILGGAVVALAVLSARALGIGIPHTLQKLVPVLTFVLIAALAWEVYELSIGIPIQDNWPADTLIDISMGLLGGVIGYYVGTRMNALDV